MYYIIVLCRLVTVFLHNQQNIYKHTLITVILYINKAYKFLFIIDIPSFLKCFNLVNLFRLAYIKDFSDILEMNLAEGTTESLIV